MMGLDEAFDEFRRAMQPTRQPGGGPENNGERESPAPDSAETPSGRVSQIGQPGYSRIVDAAIELLIHSNRAPRRNADGQDRLVMLALTISTLRYAYPAKTGAQAQSPGACGPWTLPKTRFPST